MKRRQIAIGVAIFTWGIAFPMCADQSSDADFRGNALGSTFVPYGKLSLSLPLQSGQNLSLGAVAEAPAGGASASELNKELSNPVSSLWSISNQFNNFELNNGRWNNNWNFQPVLPISLTKEWNLITLPVMPFYNIVPHPTASGEWERDAGLGDLALVELLSPAHSGNWLLGVGADLYLSDCYVEVHRPGQVAARACSPYKLPDERLHPGSLSSAMVVH